MKLTKVWSFYRFNLIATFAVCLTLLCMVVPEQTQAQDNRLIDTRNWQYEYIQRLQQRGYLLELNPTDLPYAVKDIRGALQSLPNEELSRKEGRWARRLTSSVRKQTPNVDSLRVGGVFEGTLRRSSSERLNVDAPLGDGKPLLPRAEIRGYLEWKNWIAQGGVTFDWFYDIDPDGLDTGDRLYMRSEGGYLGYNSNLVDAYIGRFDNHWSEYGRQGGFLTNNPRSFDQIKFKFGSSKLSFTSILGELDSMSADSTFTGFDHGPGSVRRYLFMHRLDWSPASNLKLSFMEGETYFSTSSGFSLKHLFPLQFLFFESSNKPRNDDVNLGIGGSIWYQLRSLTFFTQLFIDDVDIKRMDGKGENPEKIPTPYTINSTLSVTDIGDMFDLGLEADLVSVNSYRSKEYQHKWTYAQRGLATNFSDYIRSKAYLTFYPQWIDGLTVEPGITLYSKGEADLRGLRTAVNPDGTPIPGILSGTVERTVRPSLYLRYQPMGVNISDNDNVRFNFWMDADMGVNFIDNVNHIDGATNNRFIGLFRLSGELTF